MDDHAPPHPATAPQPRRSTLLAALLAAAVLLPLLGRRPLTDWDEGIYAEIAREMLAGHSLHAWLIPHWNGALWFEKPPLAMWLTAVSLRLFGLNAFAARLPSALAAIALVAILHRWLHRRRSHLTAWLSTVILLSAFGFQHAARVGETDILLSLFSLLAVLGLAELLLGNPGGWLLFFLAFALSFMTKGAASLTLPLTVLVLTALHPRLLLRHSKTFTLGLTVFLALALPWHVYLYSHFGQIFLRDYIGFHTLVRATSAIEGHHTHPWFYLWVFLVSAPPFALLYPFALAAPFRAYAPPFAFQGDPSFSLRGHPVLSAKPEGSAPQVIDFIPLPQRPVLLSAASSAKPQVPDLPCPASSSELPPDAKAGPSISAGMQGEPPLAHSTTPGLDHQSPNPLRAFAVFSFVVLALFTAASTRLPHYIAPAYPAFSALTAALVAHWLRSRLPLARRSAIYLASSAVMLYAAAAALTAEPRKALHNPKLSDGYNTPDNRESIALLQQLPLSDTTIILCGLRRVEPADLPGPLLVWRQSPVVPLTTDAFYAQRLAQQVTLSPAATTLPPNPYFNNPLRLTSFLESPHLLLLDRTLLTQLPPGLKAVPVATGPTQQLVILEPPKLSTK